MRARKPASTCSNYLPNLFRGHPRLGGSARLSEQLLLARSLGLGGRCGQRSLGGLARLLGMLREVLRPAVVEQGLAREVLDAPRKTYTQELLRAVPRLRIPGEEEA